MLFMKGKEAQKKKFVWEKKKNISTEKWKKIKTLTGNNEYS